MIGLLKRLFQKKKPFFLLVDTHIDKHTVRKQSFRYVLVENWKSNMDPSSRRTISYYSITVTPETSYESASKNSLSYAFDLKSGCRYDSYTDGTMNDIDGTRERWGLKTKRFVDGTYLTVMDVYKL